MRWLLSHWTLLLLFVNTVTYLSPFLPYNLFLCSCCFAIGCLVLVSAREPRLLYAISGSRFQKQRWELAVNSVGEIFVLSPRGESLDALSSDGGKFLFSLQCLEKPEMGVDQKDRIWILGSKRSVSQPEDFAASIETMQIFDRNGELEREFPFEVSGHVIRMLFDQRGNGNMVLLFPRKFAVLTPDGSKIVSETPVNKYGMPKSLALAHNGDIFLLCFTSSRITVRCTWSYIFTLPGHVHLHAQTGV